MREKEMSLLSRRICECLREQPYLTAARVAAELGVGQDIVKRRALELVTSGHVARGRRVADGYIMSLTGKAFPPAAEWVMSREAERLVQLERELLDTVQFVVPAFDAMCRVGRGVA
jgi:hypothetical protein